MATQRKLSAGLVASGVGPGLLAATVSILIRESSPFLQVIGSEGFEPQVATLYMGTVVAAVAMVLLCLKDVFCHQPLYVRSPALFRFSAILATCCVVAPVVIFALGPLAGSTVASGPVPPLVPEGVVRACTLAAGAGIAVLAGLWFDSLMRLEADRILACVVANLTVLGVCAFAKLATPPQDAWILYMSCVLLSCAGLFVIPTNSHATQDAGSHVDGIVSDNGMGDPAVVGTSVPARLFSFLRSIWWALAVSMVAMLLYGYVWLASRAGMPSSSSAVLVIQEGVGAIGAALVFAAVSRMRAEDFSGKLRRVVIPVAVATFIVTPYFSVDAFGDGYYNFVGCIREASQHIFLASLCMALSTSVRVADASSFLGVGICLALTMLAGEVGMALSNAFGQAVTVLPVLLYVLYLVATFIVTAHHRDAGSKARAIEEDVFERYLQKRCAVLAAEHGLSPREQEILVQLSRGHGYTYIAEASYLSESTVRTHAKNIFKKTGVGSREELLDLVDERSS